MCQQYREQQQHAQSFGLLHLLSWPQKCGETITGHGAEQNEQTAKRGSVIVSIKAEHFAGTRFCVAQNEITPSNLKSLFFCFQI